MRYIVACLAILLTSACSARAVRGVVEDSALSYNLAYERAANQLLLLNVLRARDRRPRHFTAVTSLQTVRGSSFSLGPLLIPFGRNTKNPFNLSVGGSSSVTPSLAQVVLDGRAFTQGLLSPVGGRTISHLVSQGWNQELIWLLLVKEIRITDDSGSSTIFRNQPDDEHAFDDFQLLLRSLVAAGIRFEEFPPRPVGPPLTLEEVSSLKAQVSATAAGLSIRCVDEVGSTDTCRNGFRLMRRSNEFGWKIQNVDVLEGFIPQIDKARPDAGYLSLSGIIPPTTDGLPHLRRIEIEKLALDNQPLRATSGRASAQFVVRSPESIIYYLGQIVRRQAMPDLTDVSYSARCPCQPAASSAESSCASSTACEPDLYLLRISAREGSLESHEVGVQYDDVVYEVRQETNDRGLTTLNLLGLLLGLQKDATELQGSAVLNTIFGG